MTGQHEYTIFVAFLHYNTITLKISYYYQYIQDALQFQPLTTPPPTTIPLIMLLTTHHFDGHPGPNLAPPW